jgi:hypothetical protein
MTELIIQGNLDEHFIKSAILELYLKQGIPKNVEYILVIDNPKYYKIIEPKIPRAARVEFRKAYKSDPTSMALTYGVFDLIIISISTLEEAYLKTNKKALVGLLGHELMHIKQRRRNLDRSVRADAIRAFSKFEPQLHKIKIPQKILADFFATIGESANFTLKDIYDNFQLIDEGMGDYILEDYWNLYKSGGRFSKPVFYSTKDSDYKLIEHIREAIDFELNLISAIAPFVKMARAGNDRAKKLVEFIATNYEVNISEVANEYDDVIQFAIDSFAWSSAYRQKYFTIIFKRALFLLTSIEREFDQLDLTKEAPRVLNEKQVVVDSADQKKVKPNQQSAKRKRVRRVATKTKIKTNSKKRKVKK